MVAKQRTLNFAMAFAHKLNLISKRARQRNGSLKRYYELEHKCVCLNLKKGTPERIPFLTFCDSHGVANIKIMVLLQCAHNECVILNFAGK